MGVLKLFKATLEIFKHRKIGPGTYSSYASIVSVKSCIENH